MPQSEAEILAQSPITLKIAGHDLVIESPVPNRLIRVQVRVTAMLLSEVTSFSQLQELAKAEIGKIKAESPDQKFDLDEFMTRMGPMIEAAAAQNMLTVSPAMFAVLQEICRPNKKGAVVPAPFDSREFWLEEVTALELALVLRTFAELQDVQGHLKNVFALTAKG